MDAPTTSSAAPAWAPLRHGLFRMLWIASLASNAGTLMHSVGVSWMMTTLSISPVMVALVQTATNLPTFLLALPAGALADIVDRRRLLLATQTWMLVAAGALAALTLAGVATPWLLLGVTFALGLGAALNAPAWQAIMPELVPPDELHAAVALNSAGFNLARAVGPALGGLIVAQVGPGATFALNTASFVAVLVVLFRWKRTPPESVLPTERVFGAMRVGLRYVRHAPELQKVLIRTTGFMVFGSALWALLPLIARYELHLGAEGFGILLGSLGIGGVAGAVILPRLREMMSIDRRVAVATVGYAVGAAVPALVPNVFAVVAGLVVAGAAWLVLMSGFNTSVQSISPAWVRGRTISIYLLIVFGNLAIGSWVWGMVAERVNLAAALLAPSAGMLLALAALYRMRLIHGEGMNLAPSMHWPPPEVAAPPAPDVGPVFVTVTYQIDPADEAAFLAAMQAVRRARLRGGAIRWALLGDLARPGRYVESFMEESWLHHLRLHERVTVEDQAAEARAHAFHQGPGRPVVSHLLHQALPPSR
jgi:MFS family permease